MSGSLDHSPADIIRQLLIKLALGTDPDDDDSWPIYAYRIPETPDNLIAVIDTTGKKQGRIMTDGEVQETAGIQVYVRAATISTARAKANAIVIALDESIKRSIVTISTSMYLVWNVSRTGPMINVGKEIPTSKRNVLTINAVVSLRQTA